MLGMILNYTKFMHLGAVDFKTLPTHNHHVTIAL